MRYRMPLPIPKPLDEVAEWTLREIEAEAIGGLGFIKAQVLDVRLLSFRSSDLHQPSLEPEPAINPFDEAQ
jgi:hypothetical protein